MLGGETKPSRTGWLSTVNRYAGRGRCETPRAGLSGPARHIQASDSEQGVAHL